MRRKMVALLTVAVGLGWSLVVTADNPAAAETTMVRSAAPSTDVSAQRRYRRVPPRVTVYPIYRPRLLYRQCTDWYVVEARATGPTVVPRIRCWWVRG